MYVSGIVAKGAWSRLLLRARFLLGLVPQDVLLFRVLTFPILKFAFDVSLAKRSRAWSFVMVQGVESLD